MKPKSIRVFDGLRITTEHMEHLQDSFHSALEDVREILGLGQVHSGFGVAKQGDAAIAVQPGVAFDQLKNRIVCDEPTTLPVAFEPDEEQKYVCVKYDQVEDGVVEEQPTLIWDSCSVLLRNAPPTPEDNLVPIAILERRHEQEAFEIVVLSAPNGTPGPEEAVEAQGWEATTDAAPINAEAELPMASDEEMQAGTTGDEVTEAVPTEDLPMDEAVEAQTEAEPEGPVPVSQTWRWRIGQGVVRVSGEAGGTSLNMLLLGPLRQKLGAAANSVNGSHLQFTLAEEPVALDFCPVSLSSQTILRADLWMSGEPGDGELPPIQQRVQSTSQGEALFVDDTIAQFSVTSIQPRLGVVLEGLPKWTTEVNETGIGYLYFVDHLATDAIPEDIGDVLRQLYLLIKVDQANEQGFKLSFKLIWKGGVHEAAIQAIERRQIRFTWESIVAWKALAEPYLYGKEEIQMEVNQT